MGTVCGDDDLYSVDKAFRDEDNIFDQIYEKQIFSDFYLLKLLKKMFTALYYKEFGF